jgi:hypothetical protein
MTDAAGASARAARRERLLGMLATGGLAQGCYVLAKLRLADLMAEGPRTAEDLAAASGAHPLALRRLLAALAAAGLLRESEGPTYGLTPMTELLCSDSPDSARATAIMHGEEVYRSFGGILHTIQTGEPAFEREYGVPFYTYLEQAPEVAATFAASMGAQPIPEVAFACDIPDGATVVDIGGGRGGLLAALLARAPRRRGILVELPSAAAHAKELLAEASLLDRVEIVEGSFFNGVPPGGDVYLLARVLHNWSDAHAIDALRVVRRSMAEGSRLIVLERFLSPGPAGPRSAAASRANVVDLMMLVMLEGRDRTEAEYRELLAAAGLRVVATHAAPAGSAESALVAVGT